MLARLLLVVRRHVGQLGKDALEQKDSISRQFEDRQVRVLLGLNATSLPELAIIFLFLNAWR
jgi:hypothetical protein